MIIFMCFQLPNIKACSFQAIIIHFAQISGSRNVLLISCKFASGFWSLRPVPNITMTLHSYWPVILVGGSSIRKRYSVVMNYLQSVPGIRVTECYITMSPSTGVVLNFQVGTGRCVCRACSSSVCVMVQGWQVCKNVSPW